MVSGKHAEEDLPERDRALLSLESGFNDGLALPLVLAALAMAGVASGAEVLLESLWQVAGAVLLGAVLGGVGGYALRSGERHGATARGPALLFTVVLALTILGVSGLAHTDGVLAVFIGGLVFNAVSTGSDRLAELSIDEALNRYAVLPLFLLLGATVPWSAWADLGWRGAALVVGVLVLRRLPLLLALAGPLRLRLRDALYLGWFGPVGVSALFYLTLESERLDTPSPVLAAGALVVAASTVAHGVTAAPGRAAYRRAAQG